MSFASATPGGPAGRWAGLGVAVAYLAVAAVVGLYRVGETGPLWPDAPRYANAGAMVRDWLRSDQWFHPVRFAENNYARYPAFSVPFHPPGYPAALGTWFLLTGVSHESGRAFVALCWALAGVLFYRINRELGFGRSASFAAGLLLLTTPQLATWARDTMSEVPSLVPLFAAALFWLRWLRTNRPIDGLLALALAEAAFFCRVTTAGVLPGLVIFGAVTGGWTRRRYAVVAAGCAVYLAVNAGWIVFASRYAAHEMTADGKGSVSARLALDYFAACLPGILAGGTAAVAALGLALGSRTADSRRAVGFWLAWLASYAAFKVAVPTTPEVRHFLTALPALAGLAAAVFPVASLRGRLVAWAVMVAAVGANLFVLADCPRGLVGYEPVGEALARCDRPGNVLLACPEDQDLIFRYRAAHPACDRYLLRSDRTLAVRVSAYAKVPAQVLARSEADVLELVRRGRVRYVVTASPDPDRPELPEEMRLVDHTVRAHPELFRAIGSYRLEADYVNGIHPEANRDVRIWEYAGAVEDGPPDLPIPVPTAGLVIRP